MSHAVTYTRVSSREQLKEGFSIPAQRSLLQRYAREHELTIVAEFSDDETAKTTGRTDFTRMVGYLKAHPKVRIILVEKTDRLYRNLKDYLTLEELGAETHFVKEASIISNTSHSSAKFLHGIKVLMAHNYVENLSEEVKKGMHEKARQGGYRTMAPVGYVNTKAPEGIIPDPERAPAIKELFEAAATGYFSLRDLVSLARKRGLKGRMGRPLAKTKVAFILQSELYTGWFMWGGKQYHGKYEPLITQRLFDDVQDALAGRAKPRQRDHTFAYTGLLRCATCGGMLTGDIKKERYVYYACRGREGCKRFYPERIFEDETIRLLRSLQIDATTSEWLINELAASYDAMHDEDGTRTMQLQQRANELRAMLRSAYEDKLLGNIDESTWREHHDAWQHDLDEIETIIRTTTLSIPREEFLRRVKRPFELLQTAADQYVAQPPAERRRLLQILCSNYTINDGTLTVSMRSPFDALAKAAESGDWLGGRESNPDSLVQSQLSYH